MICKEDVVSWFKELESYKRIDTMCTLLNMCLPFELRFLGTCLEELGRRDSQELRGIELRINSPQDSAIDIAGLQTGEPTDKKIRRKMALYLALIRGIGRSNVNELFKTLDKWGEKDFTKINDSDTLQELLLVYTMATNHPVFSFEQRMKCGEIFTKIEESRNALQHQSQDPQLMLNQQQQMQSPIQVIPQGNLPMAFPQGPMSQMIPTDANIQHQIAVDSIHHILPPTMAIPSEFAAIGHPNALTWTIRPNLQTYPPPSLESVSFILQHQQQQHPPQSSSPMLSQQSSPSHSRTNSPSRSSNNSLTQQQTSRNVPQRGVALRNSRRPSVETTPPPVQQQQPQPPPQQLIGLVPNDIILQQNLKSLDEVVLNADGSVQLQTLCRNGYRSGHHTIPRQSKSLAQLHHNNQHHNQHIQTIASNLITGGGGTNSGTSIGGPSSLQPATNFNMANASLAYTLQNMNLADVHNPSSILENNVITGNRHKSGGSDSGSSIGSVGDVSRPDTPTIITNSSSSSNSSANIRVNDQNNFNKQQMNLTRLNGRPDKLLSSSGTGGMGGSTSVIYASTTNSPQQHNQQQQFVGNEIILTTGPNLMSSPVTNNNNSSSSLSSAGNGSSSNNNLVTSTVLITSPSTMAGGVSGGVLASNPIILQQQQQFSATYPYHPQHLAVAAAATTRPPILSHNPTMAPPAATFRHPGFQIQPNGEILFPYPPQVAGPTGLTFLPPSGAPPAQVVRTSQSTISVPSQPQQQPPQLQPPQLQQQSQPPTHQPIVNAALLAVSPYTTLTIGNKAMSCFNCGSQLHTGRDCQEVSMEDATRASVYKLDYSSTISPVNTNVSNSSNNNHGNTGNSSSSSGGNATSTGATVEIASETLSPTSSSSSLSNSNAK